MAKDPGASLDRLDAEFAVRKEERRALWARIQAEEPELAALVKATGATILLYEVDGERLIDKPAARELEDDLAAQGRRVERLARDTEECLGRYDGYKRWW